MSLKYRDKNGAEVVLAGLTPGGNIEAGAVATRDGSISVPSIAGGSTHIANVTFSDPMIDDDYEVILDYGNQGVDGRTLIKEIYNITANGFSVAFHRPSANGASTAVTCYYKAFKLYEVADAEALYSDVTDIKAMIPANASSTNKFSTADDLRTETRTLDRRLDDVEDVIPTSASITNKLVTQSDLSGVEIDKVEDINDVELTNIQDGQTLIWDDTNSKWVNGQGGKIYTAGDGISISNTDEISAKVDDTSITTDTNDALKVADTYKTIFVGTQAEWDALSTADKVKYNEAHITDDVIGGEVADKVTDGLMSPVTSNAVYDHTLDVYSTSETKTNKVWIDGKPIYRKVVDCGAGPSGSPAYKSVQHGITNIGCVTMTYGIAIRSDNAAWLPVPYVATQPGTSNDFLAMYVTSTVITIYGGTFNFSNYNPYVVIEYTKTTD